MTDNAIIRAFTTILETSKMSFVIWLNTFRSRIFRKLYHPLLSSSKTALLEEIALYLCVIPVGHLIIPPDPPP
jgi:hypothetical protein